MSYFQYHCEAGFGCDWDDTYGFVPEAECPLHDCYPLAEETVIEYPVLTSTRKIVTYIWKWFYERS